MGTLLQVIEIIFEVQRKMSNEKVTRKEISFKTYKTRFFSSFWTPPSFELHNILIFYSILMI
jgi:hypothetical protein